jgi:hypothetical protein
VSTIGPDPNGWYVAAIVVADHEPPFAIANYTRACWIVHNTDLMFAMTNPPGDSAYERMAQAHHGWNDIRVVRALCAQLLTDAEVDPPVNVELIASLRGISQVLRVPLPWSGSLSQEQGKLVVRVNADDSHVRQRFSILHEAIHTFMPGFDERVQLRCKSHGPRQRAEVLCDLGAAELLLPRDSFAADLAGAGLSFIGIEDLAERYEASLEATAIRAVDLTPEPAMLLVASASMADEAGEPNETLRVSYAHRSGPWPAVPANTAVTDDSPLLRAYVGELVDEPSNLSEILPGIDRPIHIIARAYGRERRVLAVIRRR